MHVICARQLPAWRHPEPAEPPASQGYSKLDQRFKEFMYDLVGKEVYEAWHEQADWKGGWGCGWGQGPACLLGHCACMASSNACLLHACT
jgi:hypothetical protein